VVKFSRFFRFGSSIGSVGVFGVMLASCGASNLSNNDSATQDTVLKPSFGQVFSCSRS
jgi:hypothetical protein